MEMRKETFATIFLIFILILQTDPLMVRSQSEDKFEITQNEEVVISYKEMGLEKFRITINNNGGISEIQIYGIPYVGISGIFVWDLWQQTLNSDSLAPPEIEDRGDFVNVRFYGKYREAELYVRTFYNISKIGLILVTAIIEAGRDEPTIRQTAWMAYFPVEIFMKEKARIKFESEIREIELPEETTRGSFYGGSDVVYWVDFSKKTGGVTFINMAPGSDIWVETTVRDERQWGVESNVYCAFFAHTTYGNGAMAYGEKRTSKVTLYLHGAGAYEGNKEMIDLVSDLAKMSVECEEAVKEYGRESDAGSKADQALGIVKSGLEKLLRGDSNGAKGSLEEARNLIKEAKIAKETFQTILTVTAIVAVVIILVLLAILIRRKARKNIT
ncbi:MAG: hypothetical protein ACUVQ0_06705 [Thermoproteota archaeon]